MSKTRMIPVAVLAALATAGCDAISGHTDLVARAGGHELTVSQVAGWLAENPRLPASPEVVDAIANVWVDYILLATEAARDSTLSSLDLDLLVRPVIEQEMVWKLRDRVIQVDTALTDEELRQRYEAEQPGLEVRARHILIRLDPDATAAARDSARLFMEEIRQRALAGEDFAQLAREYSQDPGTASLGGDLDFFSRGQMVAPFEEAAFALDVGEISEVVETPFGLHIIRAEERRIRDFDEIRDSYRAYVLDMQIAEAEDAYIRQLTEPLQIQVQDGAFDVVRELASKPHTQLSSRAASRALVAYKDGAYLASDFLELMRRSSPAQRSQVAMANDDQLEAMLNGLTQNGILVREAERQGLSVTPEERDSIIEMTRQQVDAAVVAAGLKPIVPEEGETVNQAIARTVASLLREIIRQERDVVPLGPVTYSLRDGYGATVFERSFAAVAQQVEAAVSAGTSAAPVAESAAPAAGQP